MSLLSLYDLSLRGRRDVSALEIDGPAGEPHTFTFGELDARSNRLAQVLAARGVVAGDRLAFCLPESRSRSSTCGSPPSSSARSSCRSTCSIAGARSDTSSAMRARAPSSPPPIASPTSPSRCPHGMWTPSCATPRGAGRSSRRTRRCLDAARPRVHVGHHRRRQGRGADARQLRRQRARRWSRPGASRARIATSPRCRCSTCTGSATACSAGWPAGATCGSSSASSTTKALDWFEQYRPTLFFGVPTMYVRLLETPPERARAIGQGMRLFVSGSAPLPAQVLEAFAERFGHVILERYGMTETLMNVSNPLRRRAAAGHGRAAAAADGRPHPGRGRPARWPTRRRASCG